MLDTADLPDDVVALKAMLIAAMAREADTVAQIARKDERIERLEKLVAAFSQIADWTFAWKLLHLNENWLPPPQ